jgi:hypothetical protein
MSEELETILRLVADGRLTPEEAAPIIDALTRAERPSPPADRRERVGAIAMAQAAVDEARARIDETLSSVRDSPGHRAGRQLRIRVTEHGRQVVNLRIPIGFVDAALQFVPGLGGEQSQRIREAVHAGASGPILDIEEPDGSGVLISVD